jgi:hypothetical protein
MGSAPKNRIEDLFLPPRQIGPLERFGLLRREPPRLCEFGPLPLYLRVKPVAASAPAALQELLMALRRA